MICKFNAIGSRLSHHSKCKCQNRRCLSFKTLFFVDMFSLFQFAFSYEKILFFFLPTKFPTQNWSVQKAIICLIEYTSLEYHKCILLFLTSYWIWNKNGDTYVDLFGLFHWRNNISVNQNEERKGKRTNFDQSFIDMFISIYCGIYCGTRIKGKVPQIVGLTLTWKVVLSWLMTVDGLKPLSQVVCHRGLS